jgi:hypothetical protein
MPTRFLSAAEPSACSAVPESIAPEDVAAHFTLTADDLAFVRQHRGAPSRLGVALQLCALRLLGFVPADLMDAPAEALDYLAGQLDVPARAVFDSGCAGRRAATITSPSAVMLASNALTMPRWDGWRRGWPSLRSSMTARRGCSRWHASSCGAGGLSARFRTGSCDSRPARARPHARAARRPAHRRPHRGARRPARREWPAAADAAGVAALTADGRKRRRAAARARQVPPVCASRSAPTSSTSPRCRRTAAPGWRSSAAAPRRTRSRGSSRCAAIRSSPPSRSRCSPSARAAHAARRPTASGAQGHRPPSCQFTCATLLLGLCSTRARPPGLRRSRCAAFGTRWRGLCAVPAAGVAAPSGVGAGIPGGKAVPRRTTSWPERRQPHVSG